MTDPVGSTNLARYRLVDMYTACTTLSVKDSILQSFAKINTKLRVIIATVAYGMVIDCPDVRCVIHWGASLGCGAVCSRNW